MASFLFVSGYCHFNGLYGLEEVFRSMSIVQYDFTLYYKSRPIEQTQNFKRNVSFSLSSYDFSVVVGLVFLGVRIHKNVVSGQAC